MRSVYIREFGGLENLEIRDVPDPVTAEAEVLVRVRAAGLNRADLIQVRGLYPPPPGYSQNIPGLEFAGEVVETADGNGFHVGDRVFGITAGEAQAEFLKIDHRHLAHIPANLSFLDAAAVPEAFITAYDAVFSQAGLHEDESLLIHAVASGVGLAALQLAEAKGHRVFGTSRTADKLERCREFGLAEGIVVGSPPEFAEKVMAASGNGVDVVLDLVGGSYFQENLKALAVKGRLMMVGLTSGAMAEFNMGVALSKRLKLIGTILRGRSAEEKAAATRAFIVDILPLLTSGLVRPNVDRVFSADNVRAAYEYLASNESFGKVVLEF